MTVSRVYLTNFYEIDYYGAKGFTILKINFV